MQKNFNFLKDDYKIKIIVELKGTDECPVFSASGEIKKGLRFEKAGQCLEDVREILKDNKKFNIIFELWKKYHLNDMHPECEHQRALGWTDLASKKINIYKYCLNTETIIKQNEIEKNLLKRLKSGKNIKATKKEQSILNLDFFKTSTKEFKNNKFYKLDKIEEKTASWVYETEHPAGLLCKPCPVCGYKYGTAWQYKKIDDKDLKIIKNLLTAEDGKDE